MLKWLELSLRAPEEYVEPLSVIFQRYGHGGVAVEQIGNYNPDEDEGEQYEPTAILRAYLPINRTTNSRKEHIRVAVELIARLCSLPPLEERVVEEGQWMESWKEHFPVLHVGRVVILPTWTEYRPMTGEVVIDLDPGMAFGTGHHPTTRMCLLELQQLISPGVRVLDLGTGSGILAMAAAKLGAGYVLALDIDPVAVKLARANIRANGLQRLVKVECRSLSVDENSQGDFDVVVANLFTKVILELAPAIGSHLAPGGTIVASGIVMEKASAVGRRLGEIGCPPLRMNQEGDWIAFVGAKNRS